MNRIQNRIPIVALAAIFAVFVPLSVAYAQTDLGGGYYGGGTDLGGGYYGGGTDLGGGYYGTGGTDVSGSYYGGSGTDLGGTYYGSNGTDLGGSYYGSNGIYGGSGSVDGTYGASGSADGSLYGGSGSADGSLYGASGSADGSLYGASGSADGSLYGGSGSVDGGLYGGSGSVDTCVSTCYTSPTYAPSTPYYSAPCDCYSSSPTYGYSSQYGVGYASAPIYGAMPGYGVSYAPTYSVGGYIAPHTSGPVYSVRSTPANNTNVNTNTNTPTAVATVAPITNTNTASTGAITNNFAPVINVGAGGPQRLVQATIPAPSCTIFAGNSYQTGYYNQPITLTWNSQYATSAYISPNVGSVQPQGSQMVYPSGYTTYTMTVYGAGGSATCQTTANYAGGYIAPAPIYAAAPAPIVPSVSLTQIPYTGFDFGPVGNAMYWAALFALAAAAAYLFVYYLPSGLKFSFAGASTRSATEETNEVMEVFKSPFTPMSVLEPESEGPVLSARALPSVEHYRITTDSMIVDTSGGTPRIVIARQ